MEIKTTYTGITKDGIKGIWCGFKPDNITVTNEQKILYPEYGKVLRHIETGLIVEFVLLKNKNMVSEFEEIEERND